MKSTDNKEKELRELSEEELKNVTGGLKTLIPKECEDTSYAQIHLKECGIDFRVEVDSSLSYIYILNDKTL